MLKFLLFTVFLLTAANASSDESPANIPSQTILIVGENHAETINRNRLINLAVAKKIVLFQEARSINYYDLKLKKFVDVERDAVPIYELEGPLIRMMLTLLGDYTLNTNLYWKDKKFHSIMQASAVEGVQKRFESLLMENIGDLPGYKKLSSDQLKLSRGFRNELLEITLKQCLESCDSNVLRTYFYEGSPTRKLIERKIEGKPGTWDVDEYTLSKQRDLVFSNNVFKVLKEHKFEANVPIVLVVGDNHRNGVAEHLKQFGFNPQVWKLNLMFGDGNSARQWMSAFVQMIGASKCLEKQGEFDCFLDAVEQRGPILDWTEFKQPNNFKESNFLEKPTDDPPKRQSSAPERQSSLPSSSIQIALASALFLSAAIF